MGSLSKPCEIGARVSLGLQVCTSIMQNERLVYDWFSGGNTTFQQIELDMLRLAAIYIVERMKPRLMPYFLLLLSQHQQKHQKASQTLGKLRSAFQNS